MNKNRGILLLVFMGGAIQAMINYRDLPSERSMFQGVQVYSDVWQVSTQNQPTPMVFTQPQIISIVYSMPHHQAAAVLANNSQSIPTLVAYIESNDIHPDRVPEIFHGRSNGPQTRTDYQFVMDRMRQISRAIPRQLTVTQVDITKRLLGYRDIQQMGNVSKLEFIKKGIEQDLREASKVLKATIWRDWVKQMEREIVVLDKLINSEIAKELNIIRTRSLADAEAAVARIKQKWPYCNPVITTIQEHQKARQYLTKVGFNELAAAQDLLALRPDYQRMLLQQKAAVQLQQQQQQVQPSQTILSQEGQHLIISEPQLVADVSKFTLSTLDMSLTTPTDPDVLFRQTVTANPETDFHEYMDQVGQVLHKLGSKGLYTADQLSEFTKEVAQGIANHLVHAVEHPVEYAQEFLASNLALAHEALQLAVIFCSAPEGPYATDFATQEYMKFVDRKMSVMTEKYDQICATIPQMSRAQWADLVSKIIVDGLITHKVGKAASVIKNTKLPASVIKHPLFSKAGNLEQAMARQAEVVTAEGMTFKMPQALEDTNLLQNAAEKVGNGSTKSAIGQKIEWADHYTKHRPNTKSHLRKLSWDEIVKYTKHEAAMYKLDIDVRALELYAWEHGKQVTIPGKNWKVFKCDRIIGANSGKETCYMRIECSANVIHGHPILESDYLRYLK